jgi:hypothetical protein
MPDCFALSEKGGILISSDTIEGQNPHPNVAKGATSGWATHATGLARR